MNNTKQQFDVCSCEAVNSVTTSSRIYVAGKCLPYYIIGDTTSICVRLTSQDGAKTLISRKISFSALSCRPNIFTYIWTVNNLSNSTLEIQLNLFTIKTVQSTNELTFNLSALLKICQVER